MKLIIAEKPSVAQTIAAALGVKKRRDGYLEGDDTLISWCVGHLTGLADASIYDARYGAWKLDDLPIIPEKWRYVVRSEKMKQFKILSGLMAREDVTEIINACDAGREGELIFRTVYKLAGCRKPIKRLWISSMEDEAIRDGMAHLKEGADYDGLYHAALCRSKADWLVGINATRFFTLLYNHTLKIGRVMSPTLALIVQREAEIRAFTPEPFFTVQLDLNPTVFSERLKSKEEAEALAGLCKGKTVNIRQITRRQKFEPAPKLYDLTTLQREANRVLGYTAQQTLDYAQSLYQQKLCTYPRTDSRYLTDDMEPRVPEYVTVAAKICGVDIPAQINAGQVCDSSQVSDHFALIPTLSCTETALASVPAGERELLKLLALSVLRAVSGPYVTEETEVIADCEGRAFTAKGHTIVDTGWRHYVEGEAENKPLPALMEGQRMNITGVSIKEGKTSAPKRYTEAALLAAMESAGIGTPATRAEIIEKLIAAEYMVRKRAKKTVQLVPTPIGASLITVLPEQLQSPELTAEWEKRLSEVERGELSPEDFDKDVENMISDLVHSYKPVDGSEVLFSDKKAAVGKCPRCGFPVVEREKGFFCENRACRFVLWKENHFFSTKHKSVTPEVAAALLNDGKVRLTNCYSEKKGKCYDATVMLEDDGERTGFKIAF